MEKIIESLSAIERKILPFLNLAPGEIMKKTGMDKTSFLRALKFLENKKILNIKSKTKKIIYLGVNGIYYEKNGLPERRLLSVLESKKFIPIEEAKKNSRLSDNEFRAAIGTLKKKSLINISNGKLSISVPKEELIKKLSEEKLLETLPIEEENLSPEEKKSYQNLKSRKNIVESKEISEKYFELTELGKKIINQKIKKDLIEEVNSEVINSNLKNKKFRRYDIQTPVPQINGGKKHFVNQSVEYAKEIWINLGFKEMTGNLIETAFWNFDALFSAQDHPAREMQDSFFIKDIKGKLPEKEIVSRIKKSHETGTDNSRGWNYKWSEKEAEKILLRTHTTSLSARTLSELEEKDLPAKYFAVGKCFRNETIDWSHGFEFNQTEGIVIDEKVNFRHLLGYLKQFFKEMGFEKIRFTPAYFPYTEPSVEISSYHFGKKKWLELGGAGIFRPEVTIPLFGKKIPVLAWGPGLDRIMMDYYKIKDLRELYSNNIKSLREKKTWTK